MDHPDSDDEALVTSGSHYFTDAPTTPSRPSTVRLALPERTIELRTDRGVFSADRVDPGTKVLLMELPELPPGPVVDVGCGYGPIATTLAARRPDQPVWAVDVNARARALCEENLAPFVAAGTEAHVVAPEQVPDELRVAAIVSNPPIRVGKGALHSLLTMWLGRLTDDGEAWLVVQKHLGADSLAKWLETPRGDEMPWAVERVRSRQGYRILRVTRPPR